MRRRRAAVPFAVAAMAVVLKGAQLVWCPDRGGPPVASGVRQLGILAIAAGACAAIGTRPRLLPFTGALGQAAPALLIVTFALAAAVSGAPGWRLVALLVVTGLGEELIFRGLLLDLAEWTLGRSPALFVSVAFGAWHLPDERGHPAMAAVALVATGAASLLVLIPARRRSGTILWPVAIHVLVNGTVLLASGWPGT